MVAVFYRVGVDVGATKLSRLSFYALASHILMWRGIARMTEELPCLTAGTVDQGPSMLWGSERIAAGVRSVEGAVDRMNS
jgi:hypothetical protein